VRHVADLTYRDFLTAGIHDDPLIGEEAKAQLTYYPTVTREPFEHAGRITDRIKSGAVLRRPRPAARSLLAGAGPGDAVRLHGHDQGHRRTARKPSA
jgi:hypothetical protein